MLLNRCFLIFIILILFYNFSFSQYEFENKKIDLTVNYKKQHNSPLMFYWTNVFYEKPEQFVFEKDIKKKQKIDAIYPFRIISIDQDKESKSVYTSFLVFPNDTLLIEKNKHNQTTISCKNNQARTNELNFFKEMNQELGEFEGFMVDELPISTPSKERIDIKENLYNKRVHFLEQYSLKYSISETFKKQIKSSFYYQALSSITFPYYSPYATSRKKEDSVIVKKMINLFKVDETHYFQPEYRSSILNYVVFLSKNNHNINWNDLYKVALNSLTGNTKEVIIFDILRMAFKENQEAALSIYNLYLKDANHPIFKGYAISNYQPQFEALKSRKNALVSITKRGFFYDWNEVIRKNNYKISYIDFWASWCGPCRTEMPYSKKIQQEYSKKGVSFVYVSIDENAASWEKSSNQIGLPDTESYLLPNSKESEIAKQFNLTTIPRYLIIGKDGKVINADAPRPSDPRLRELFDELLKK